MKAAVVIPAHNEASVIGSVIKSIPSRIGSLEISRLIVVDDASTDNTSEVARKAGAIVLRHRFNLGAGGATITGMKAARRLGVDLLVTLDADGQHDPNEIGRLAEPIIAGEADVVIGSRLINPEGMPKFKQYVNKFANFVTFLFSGMWVTDSQSGFKVFSKNALEKMSIKSIGYEFCTEMVRQINTHKLKLRELPIKAIYTEYSKGKGQSAVNGINIVVKLLINRIIPE